MKYSQLLGLLACIGQIFVCFLPWSFVAEKNILITGMNAAVTDFGKPGLMNIMLGGLMGVLFAIPVLWAKRINVVVAAINIAWSIRNYLLVSGCHFGECPENRLGIYALLSLSFIILILTFFPPVKLQPQLQ